MTKRMLSAILTILVVMSVAVAISRHGDQAAAIVGDSVVTGGGAGVFPAGATFNGIELAGGTFGLGAEIATDGSAVGDLGMQLNGSSLIGPRQWMTTTGRIARGAAERGGR